MEKTIMEGYMPGKRKRGRPKKRWAQDVIDNLRVSASEAGRLARDRVIFRKTVLGAKFLTGHATNE